MKVTVDARRLPEVAADLLALPLAQRGGEPAGLPTRFAPLDRALGGRLRQVLESGDFRGKAHEALLLYADPGAPARRVLLLGLGPAEALDADALRGAAGSALAQAEARGAQRLALAVPRVPGLAAAARAQALAEGALLADYRFDRYREPPKDAPARVASLALSFERARDVAAARPGAARGAILAESQNLARDLSNEPANALPPAALAEAALRLGREAGLRVKVFDVPELERRGMRALLAVGGGSSNPPRLIVIEHRSPRARGKRARRGGTLCLVGKGITFDSGGISIKPAAGMEEMKHDMSGAAAVMGALRACALLKIPRHVVGVIAAAENLPSGTAYRPGDVVTAMSGRTIEVLNTDAEGRVVLADALHYARTEFEPVAIVDLATLTGACKVSLGALASGLFSNHEKLSLHVRRAGEATAERVWPMPLWEGHRKLIRSDVADLKNTGGRDAGASTAAAFLAAFVGDTPWAHLDIAGTGYTGNAGPTQRKGATGVGVRLLVEMLHTWEKSGV